MLASIVAKLLGSAGFGFLDRVLGHIERKADSETERMRINASREKALNAEAAGVVKAGMQFPMFWVAWSIAAIPTCVWFGWGMLDSTLNGDLPDVAALPPQLKEYADVVFGNIFYSGAALGGAQVIASAIRGRK
jgi:hypothetical protein